MDAGQIVQALLGRIRDWFGQTDQLAMMTGYSLAGLMGAFLTMVLLCYFLVSGRSITHGLFSIVPPHRRALVARIWARLDPVLTRYFLGMIVVVIYATIAAYIGLGVILGIDHAVLLALLTGVLETVPVIGPTSAAVIAGLVSLRTATGLMSILDYAFYATALRLSIDQIVGPIVLGGAANVHPVLIIFCFLAGAVLLGIPGVILAVPVALMIKNTLATLYGEDVAECREQKADGRRYPTPPCAKLGYIVLHAAPLAGNSAISAIMSWSPGNLFNARKVAHWVGVTRRPADGGVGFGNAKNAVAAQPSLAGAGYFRARYKVAPSPGGHGIHHSSIVHFPP